MFVQYQVIVCIIRLSKSKNRINLLWLLTTRLSGRVSQLGSPLGKLDHQQTIYCPKANFGPLLRGSITKPVLITAFDTCLTQRSQGAWYQVWVPIPSWVWTKILLILNEASWFNSPWVCPNKYVNLKSPIIKESKNRSLLKKFKQRRQDLHEISNPRSIVCRRCFSNSTPDLWC